MTVEHLDVLVVGAGLSGIAAGYYLQTRCPGKRYLILEARDRIGGTWDLFRYPGVRSDSDMFTLGYSFRPWDRPEAIAEGPAIRDYIEETAAAFAIDQRIRFNHRVRRVAWDSEEARWTVEAEGPDGEAVRLTCNFLYTCTGYYKYDHGYLPQWPGMETFSGQLIHPQAWPEELDVAGQHVVVIGSGATAVTLVPALAEEAGRVTMLQRSPSYIVSRPARDGAADWLRRWLPERLAHGLVRWKSVLVDAFYYQLMRRRPEMMKEYLIEQVQEELGPDFDVATHFTPRYDPWDERLCLAADGDFFEAIRAGKVSMVTDHIETFTPCGVRLRSGRELEADIVVAATGLVMRLLDGVDVVVDGQTVDLGERITYRGMMLDGVPNLAMTIGYTNASWTLRCELVHGFVCRLLNYMEQEGYVRCTPRRPERPMAEEPPLNLTSGYVQRALPSLPSQGERRPWRIEQNYVVEWLAFRFGRVDDGALAFA